MQLEKLHERWDLGQKSSLLQSLVENAPRNYQGGGIALQLGITQLMGQVGLLDALHTWLLFTVGEFGLKGVKCDPRGSAEGD